MSRLRASFMVRVASAVVLTGLIGPPVVLAGEIRAWGRNEYGETNVPAGDDFTAVAAGSYHALALRADGSLAGWGRNSAGQINVPSGNDYIAITAGGAHSLALRADGSLVTLGHHGVGAGRRTSRRRLRGHSRRVGTQLRAAQRWVDRRLGTG